MALKTAANGVVQREDLTCHEGFILRESRRGTDDQFSGQDQPLVKHWAARAQLVSRESGASRAPFLRILDKRPRSWVRLASVLRWAWYRLAPGVFYVA